jgi:hypothetical protein
MNLKALCSAGILLLAGGGAANAVTISYPDFSDLSAFTLNGDATGLNPSGNVLNLTDGLSQGGSAFLTTPVTLLNESSFSTTFEFRIDDPSGASDIDGQGADGIVFVVQTVANSTGGIGGGIGYLGITNSVGVEFDTWNNGPADDNNGNHVGINLAGSVDSVVQSGVPTRMNNGAVWSAWVDYDGLNDLLEVRLAETGVRPASALLSYSVDLVGELGQAEAFIGFTSGTGAAGGDHDILSWTFVDDFDPIDGTVPTPGILALLAVGMLGLRIAQTRR